MKVMVIVKATKSSEAGVAGTEAQFAEMGRFNEELVRAGIMLAGDGLLPSSKGKRVVISGSKRTVVDGPFAETTELVAGFWIWQVRSMDEAVEWARRCPDMGEEGVLELRAIAELEDLGPGVTEALRAKEDALREQLKAQGH